MADAQNLDDVDGRAIPVALSIAGSDSGGGAGIQADLKTFTACRVFGTTAITCVTAQNPDEVSGVAAIEPDMVRRQIAAVCRGFPVAAAKTGMLYAAETIQTVARAVGKFGISPLVVDPVMVATSGAKLLRDDAVESLKNDLIPLATVITPNLPEAEILCGRSIASLSDLRSAAEDIASRYDVSCVLKGGHLAGAEHEAVVDVLCANGACTEFAVSRIAALETHGTGCTFSAAMAAGLAKGLSVRDATRQAQQFVARALARAPQVGPHRPLGQGIDQPRPV